MQYKISFSKELQGVRGRLRGVCRSRIAFKNKMMKVNSRKLQKVMLLATRGTLE